MKNKKPTKQKQTKRKTKTKIEQRRYKEKRQPILRFSPTAWAKLLYFRDKSENEIGGFGITEGDDLLFITDFVTIKQEVTPVTVKFDDEAVADLFETHVDLGRKPEQFARVWLHTHPSDFAEPSVTDEETFLRVFGNCQWAVMCILAKDNQMYTRIRFNIGPGCQIRIPVEIDYIHDFGPSEAEKWSVEYDANVQPGSFGFFSNNRNTDDSAMTDLDDYALPREFVNELENMEPTERQFVLNELVERPDLWNEEQEDIFL
jgi:proteasome lid subunit RPN8/RPN11